ncbi:MAG: hypothetical protein ACK45R_00375, partial [Candidatus Kapaibacterium sp.]
MHRIILMLVVLTQTATLPTQLFAGSASQYGLCRIDGFLSGGVVIDSNSALTFGEAGMLLLTRDKGVTWTQISGTPLKDIVSGVVMPNKDVVLFGPVGNIVFLSPPYTSCKRLPGMRNQTQVIVSSCALSDNELMCVDNYGVSGRYVLGDTLLNVMPALQQYNIRCVARLQSGVVFAGTTVGVIRSLDSGRTWTVVRRDSTSQDEAVFAHVSTADTVVIGFCDPTQATQRLHITGDSGRTWKTSSLLSLAGPILWFGSGSCQVYNYRGRVGSMLGRTVSRVEFLYKPVSRIVHSISDTSRYMSQAGVLNAFAFDDRHTIMVGANKTIYRSSDGGRSFSLRSHISDPSALKGSNYAMTSVYDGNILTWTAAEQRYSSSTDGGATWMPRTYPVGYGILPRALTTKYVAVSPNCYIGASKYQRLDITTDGGNTYSHPGVYGPDGMPYYDEYPYTVIISADTVLRITTDSVTFITDSCRKWRKISDLKIGKLKYPGLDICTDRRLTGILATGNTVYAYLYDSKYNYNETIEYFSNDVILRSRNLFRTWDTIFTIRAASGRYGLRLRGDSNIYYQVNETLYRSTNQGDTWDTMLVKDAPREVWFEIPKDSVFVFLQGYNIMITQDSGRSWISVPPPVDHPDFYWGVLGFSKNRAFVFTNVRDITNLYRIDFAPDSGITQSVEAEPPSKPSPVWVRAAIPNP